MDRLESKKIGVLGGTFDPIHYGHLIISEKAREEFNLDFVIFIPSGIPPHKKKVYASSFDRKKMVEFAIKDNKYFRVSDIEILKDSISYTYETIIEIKKEYTNSEIFLIVGEDSFYDIPNWYRAKDLIKEVVFLVAKRSEKEILNDIKLPLNYKIIHSPFVDISSTYIRNCIFENKSVKYLLPDKVIEYIKKRKLYAEKND
ncbi:MAG: nicotinate-nucleotide adenylyltransferase [Candidatus Omnitrophica bacterium]|nr:nicotinate-nucleotide adenylyltransferase [Candidatus Omnitrophota bacterium]